MSPENASAPFLNYLSFTEDESPSPLPMRSAAPNRSPFLSIYELGGQTAEGAYDDPAREAFAMLMDELYDEEFDEALDELESNARALHDQQLDTGAARADADRIVALHFAQLIDESEAMMDAMAREFGSRDETGLTDDEFDSFQESYLPGAPLEPEFENFFGSLMKKVGRVAKAAAGQAWKGIKAVALGPIFGQLRKLLRPILTMVLKRAIGALPVAVRPMAQKLAEKLGLAPPATATASASSVVAVAGVPQVYPTGPAMADIAAATDSPTAGYAATPPVDVAADGRGVTQDPAGADAPTTQQEFDELIASAFLASGDDELNLDAAHLRSACATGATPVFAELDDAREQFIQNLNDLRDGESAEPYIQSFLPAVLPALQLGVRVIGRQRVKDFISPLMAKLVEKSVGPAGARALSQAIVESGLKLMNLEMSEAERSQLAGAAVAATVEDTVGRIAALPDHVLDDQELLEGFALEAFEQAAAANLPAVFSEATYRRRPDLLEAGINAGWVLLPLRGRKRYKRCTRVFKVRVSPHMAEEVESFEGAPLSEYLEDALGVAEGADIEAEIQLYEALPGTTVGDIARGERETLGPGLSDEANAAQLHPLTPGASAVLLGRPGLGRASGSDPRRVAVGQRFYHLAVPGRRPLAVPGRYGHPQRPQLRRRFHLNVTLDSVRDEARVSLFLSEVKAQTLAVQIRKQVNVGVISVSFRNAIARRLQRIFSGASPRRLRLVDASTPPGQHGAQGVQNLPRVVANAFASKMQTWMVQGFADFLRNQPEELLAASQDPADGLTLRFAIVRPPGLKELCRAAADRGPTTGSALKAITAGTAPTVRVTVIAGHDCA